MACLKNLTRSQNFNQPKTQPFSDPVKRQNDKTIYLREDPVLSNIMVHSLYPGSEWSS